MKLITSILIFMVLSSMNLRGQHFDPIYNTTDIESSTWRDSGYYFVPELITWEINQLLGTYDGNVAFKVRFSSTDESGLIYTGIGNIIAEKEPFSSIAEFVKGSSGISTLLLPQDLLLCPSADQEMSMGQNDPYFPLFLSGNVVKIGGETFDDPIPISFQLNRMRVN